MYSNNIFFFYVYYYYYFLFLSLVAPKGGCPSPRACGAYPPTGPECSCQPM